MNLHWIVELRMDSSMLLNKELEQKKEAIKNW